MRKHVWSIKPSDRNRVTFPEKHRSFANTFQIKQEHFLNFKNKNQIANTIKIYKSKIHIWFERQLSSTLNDW